MSKQRPTSKPVIDDILEQLNQVLRVETETEIKLKIVDRVLKALAIKAKMDEDSFGKGFGGDDD